MPATRADLDTLKAFQTIAGGVTTHASDSSTLTIYLPALSLTDEQASALCACVCPGAFEAAAPPICEQSLGLHLDGLYGGLGARLVPLAEIATLIDPASPTASPSSHSDVYSSPPGYDMSAERLAKTSTDAGTASPPPPPPPSYQPPDTVKPLAAAADEQRRRKRQRLDSPETQNKITAKDDEHHDVSSVLQALQRQTDAAHRAIARLEALQATAQDREAALEEAVVTADAKLTELAEATTVDHCQEDMSSQQDHAFAYINDRMYELRQELIELLDDRLDTFGLDMLERGEVEDLVEAQVDAAVKDFKERLASSGIKVVFS